jgi:toxin ParE1/3/4
LNEVVWTAESLANLRAIRAYIEQFNPAAAETVASRLINACQSLRSASFRGRPVPGTTIREVVAYNPYVIRYRVTGGKVVILRIRHSSRRPTQP